MIPVTVRIKGSDGGVYDDCRGVGGTAGSRSTKRQLVGKCLYVNNTVLYL